MLVGALAQPDAFRGMLDSLADGVYLVDRDRRILFWTDASERISGYAAPEVVGHRCFENILRHIDCNGTRPGMSHRRPPAATPTIREARLL